VIAGVASGLGAYLGIETVLVRIAFVALTFLGGVGVVAYVAAWLLLPASDGSDPIGLTAARRLGESRGRGRLVAGAILLALAVIILADSLSSGHAGLNWGLGLIMVGVLLLAEETWPSRDTSGSDAQQVAAEATSSSSRYQAGAVAPAPTGAPSATAHGWTPSPAQSAPARPAGTSAVSPAAQGASRSQRRSVLGWITTAVALLAVGIAALLDAAGVVSVSAGSMLSLGLIVLGAGLIVGAWVGRSRALIAISAAVLPFAAAASLIQVPIAGGTGDRTVTASTSADLKSEYRLGAGQLVLDFSGLEMDGASRSITASVAFGQLRVVAPRGTALDVHAHAGAGDLDVLGHTTSGVQVDTTASTPASSAGGTLHLDLRVGFGQVRAVQAGALGAAS
jgi:phage shock protein PspC (stress-responsive transcriptional regulator)